LNTRLHVNEIEALIFQPIVLESLYDKRTFSPAELGRDADFLLDLLRRDGPHKPE
jgi:hypothetical protein